MTFLTEEERRELKSFHRAKRDRKEADRIKAVWLSDRRWNHGKIVEALLLEGNTIGQHISEYKQNRKLKNESGGSSRELSSGKTAELFNI